MSLILSGTDGLSDVDGSAATPAIRGTDANTGIFFPAADTIAFSEGGTEAARFDSAGNFGVGMTPTYRLDVTGTSGVERVARLSAVGTDTNAFLELTPTGVATGVVNATTTGLGLAVAGSTKATILASGNMGLGVTPPTSTDAGNVTIKGGSTLNFSTASGNIAANATFNSGWKYIATAAAVKYTQSGGEHQFFNAASGTAGNAISFTQAMTLDASGNLGVGTTSPAARLSLGNLVSAQKLLMYDNSDNFKYGFGIQANELRQFYPSDASLTFGTISTANGSTFTERARFDSSGNLLVGDTANTTGSPTFYVKPKSGLMAQMGFNFSSTTTSANPNNNLLTTGSYYNGSLLVATQTTAVTYQQANGEHYWYTNTGLTAGNTFTGIERARIDSSGRLLVGTTSAYSGNGMSITSNQNTIWTVCTVQGQNALVVQNAANVAGLSANLIAFNVSTPGSGTTVGSISYNGTNVVLNPTSDVRLKENIVDAGSALAKINAVRIRSFNWKSNNHFTDFGVIAQELIEVAPECVKAGSDEINTDGELKDPWCAQPYVLVPAMIKAIQEQQALIIQLTARLDAANL
jgi:hypothetical protein